MMIKFLIETYFLSFYLYFLFIFILFHSLDVKAYTVADISRVADAYSELIIGRPNDADTYSQLFGRFYVGELVIWKLKLADYEVMHAFTNSGYHSHVICFRHL